jgi:hypothetical protein
VCGAGEDSDDGGTKKNALRSVHVHLRGSGFVTSSINSLKILHAVEKRRHAV